MELHSRLETFLRPQYQDLDGTTSRFDEVERVAAIARRLHSPGGPDEERRFELLMMFHLLGRWLEKVGNISRTMLTVDVSEDELRATAASIRRLDAPRSDGECAVAAALLIDRAGVRGLTELFARARREGSSPMDVVRLALSDAGTPEWLPQTAVDWLHRRRTARRDVCRILLEELQLEDL